MQVVATKLGYYEHRRRKPGQKFKLKDKKDFSQVWMRAVDPKLEPQAHKAAMEAKKQALKLAEDIKAGLVPEPKFPLPAKPGEDDEEESEEVAATDTMVI